MVELLRLRYHVPSDGYAIVNGRNQILGITMIPESQLQIEAPGKTLTEKLRWIIDTNQYVPTHNPDERDG